MTTSALKRLARSQTLLSFIKTFNVFVLLAQQPFEVMSSIHEMGHQMEIVLLLSSKTLEIFLSWEKQHRGEYANGYLSESVSNCDMMESATDSRFKIAQGKK